MAIKPIRIVRDRIDTVEASDINKNVENWNRQLQWFKVLTYQYPEITPLVNQLESVVSQMRTVKVDDYLLDDDINRFVEAWKITVGINEIICPSIDPTPSECSELKSLVEQMSYIKTGDIIYDEIMNRFSRAWELMYAIDNKITRLFVTSILLAPIDVFKNLWWKIIDGRRVGIFTSTISLQAIDKLEAVVRKAGYLLEFAADISATVSDAWVNARKFLFSKAETITASIVSTLRRLAIKAFYESIIVEEFFFKTIVKSFTAGISATVSDVWANARRVLLEVAETLNATIVSTLKRFFSKMFYESVTLGEFFGKTIYRFFTADVSASVSDVWANIRKAVYAFAETVSADIIASVKRLISKVFSESVVIGELFSKTVVRFFTVSTVMTITDAWENLRRAFISIAESISASIDAVLSRVISKLFSETVSLTETFTKTVNRFFTASVSAVLSDVAEGFKRVIAELTETITSNIDAFITKWVTPVITDVASAIDALRMVIGKRFSDAVSTTETFTRTIHRYITATVGATLSDAWSNFITSFISIVETVNATVTASVKRLISKAFSESVAVDELFYKTVARFFTVDISAAVSDAWQTVKTMFVSLSETVTASIDAVISRLTSISLSDVIALTDAMARIVTRFTREVAAAYEYIKLGVAKLLTDTVTLTDSVSKTVYRFITVDIATSISDAWTNIKRVLFSYMETITATITTTLKRLISKAFSDSISLTDTLSKTINRFFTVDITSSITDVAVGFKRVFADLAESIYATIDSVIVKIASKIFTDSITLYDAIVKVISKPLSECYSFYDYVKRVVSYYLKPVDIFEVYDYVKSVVNRLFTDAITVTDSMYKTVIRPFAANISSTLSDVWENIRRVLYDYVETLTVSITTTIKRLITKIFYESIVIGELFSKTVIKFFTVDITTTVTDAWTNVKRFFIAFSETISSSVTTHVMRLVTKVFSEPLSVADQIRKASYKIVSECYSFYDYVKSAVSLNVKPVDIFEVYDYVKRTVSYYLKPVEIFEVYDYVERLVNRLFTDGVALSDSISKVVTRCFSVSMSSTVSDAWSFIRRVLRTFTETLHATVSSSIMRRVTKTRSDSVSLADSISKLVKRYISVSISSHVLDSYVRKVKFYKSISESVSSDVDAEVTKYIHTDAPHSDSSHSDSTHSDVLHSDAPVHSDSSHSDVSYSDISHSDVAHSNVSQHGDFAHSDISHGDTSHSDATFSDYPGHLDYLPPGGHSDVSHNDIPHEDIPHDDWSTHSDVSHSDVAHSDVSHSDTPSHLDFSDHSDAPHSDAGHSDVAHSDVAHSDHADSSMTGWLSGWSYRKKHYIKGSSAGSVSNYQIRITVHYGSGTDGGGHVYLNGKCRSDFGDIRFTSFDGQTQLSYWIEEKSDGNYAVFWVKIPSIPAYPNSTYIYIYYGNSSATTTSNGSATFDDFDDFSTNTLSSYVQIDSGWYIENGILKIGSTAQGFISKPKSLGRNYAIRARVYMNTSDLGVGFIWGSAGGSEGSVSGYIANYHNSSAYSELRRYVSGSFTGLTSLPTLGSGWYVIEVRITSEKIIVVRNGVKDCEATDTYYTTLSGIGFRQKSDNTNAVDWWALRKYVDPEPTHGGWGSEESL